MPWGLILKTKEHPVDMGQGAERKAGAGRWRWSPQKGLLLLLPGDMWGCADQCGRQKQQGLRLIRWGRLPRRDGCLASWIGVQRH